MTIKRLFADALENDVCYKSPALTLELPKGTYAQLSATRKQRSNDAMSKYMEVMHNAVAGANGIKSGIKPENQAEESE